MSGAGLGRPKGVASRPRWARLALDAALTLSALTLAIAPSPTSAAKPPRPLPLHATRGADPAVVDARGREVLLRGVNVNQLGDYHQGNPAFETVVPLRRGDFARIARIGFNSVRLVINWSRLEPERGNLSSRYIRRIRWAIRTARSFGLYVVLDMHQDAWGKHIATPPGEVCAPGSEPAIGWDGAPRWATITDGLPTCRFGLRELSPAVGRAWQSFWDDRAGIQTALIRTWGKLARRFAANPTVAGYDLINEPNPGLLAGVTDATDLGRFYGRAIEAIREGERSRKRGFGHVVFFEPSVIWSAASTSPIPLPSFTADRNIVFAPHIYAESISRVPIERAFDFAEAAAASYGVTVWSGEWGYFGEPRDDRDRIARYAAAEDEHLYGGAWWSWKQACGDPHVIQHPGAEPQPISPSLNRYACPAERSLGVPKPFKRVLSRPYVRAAPGELRELSSDPWARELSLAGVAGPGRGCGLRVFFPSGRGRPRVEGDNLRRVRVRRVLGDWSVRACVEGGYALRLSAGSGR